ncbi:thiolase family protein [Haliangium ochraceum]|uniref:Acetyl-CoA acetyltransferase n=1 Tax=Haliangium ochraceum (strain DSM 14365 / JCM 11303 / SMP-2) TaxID=502025 RepID=D0LYD1_HALO1|nr:acetyl-CoA C-acyltransferase [Haliangium ochraceum]ACY16281.1 acetyl-CoA acetyltransferase [Haliangium ochraceum DSM 14365]
MRDVVIVGAARTPIGSFLGSLASVPAPTLGAVAISAALERAGVAASDVDEVYMGCVLAAGLGQAPARQAAIAAGIPHGTPCDTVNKMCGSGLETVVLAYRAVAMGDRDIVVAGGMESMSNAPYLLPKARSGARMGHFETVDSMLKDGLVDAYNGDHMGVCAELCAREKGFDRGAQDDYAAESYRRALAAQAAGQFEAEIAPVTIKGRKGDTVVSADEEPGRGDIDKLPKLRAVFAKEGTVTAGNASSLNDGAAALVLMTREEADKRGLPIVARVVASGHHAQAPEWFTTAPAGAIEQACKKAGWEAASVDLWELNEAFSVVSLANNAMVGLDAAKVNVRGGAVALGHPIGASGARILVTLLYAMQQQDAKTGGASLCIGGGEGIALLVERN